MLLERYVEERPELSLVDLYIDNGKTGTNFERPEFSRLINDVKQGRINCIVVKDLSRFGRNYLETGFYLQKIFPFYNLRFIAINDEYDSKTADPDSMTVSMKNIVNDYYSKDISRKVSSSFDVKRSNGVYSWGHPPYGYRRNKEDPDHYVIDEETSPYVHLIFQWAMDGVPVGRIANTLTDMQAPTYQRLAHIRSNGKTKRKGSDNWSATTVKQILHNQSYAGDFICNKSYFRKYDPGNGRWIPEDEWIIIPDAHPAYITRDDFFSLRDRLDCETAARVSRMKGKKQPVPEILTDKLSGLLYCGLCGRKMRADRKTTSTYPGYYLSYICTGQANQLRTGHRRFCYNARAFEVIVLWQLNFQIRYAIDTEELLKRFSLEEAACRLKAKRQADINMLNAKAANIKAKRAQVFEDFTNHILDEESYRDLMDRLANELDGVAVEIQSAVIRRDEVDTYFRIDNEWLQNFVKTGFQQEPDEAIIHQLIKRIDVFPDDRLRITYNYADSMEPLIRCVEEWKEMNPDLVQAEADITAAE